jgi:hypothetical protein
MELLAKQPIVHPTRVERVTICGDRMEMVVSGYPWWLGGQASVPSPQITLIWKTACKTFQILGVNSVQ